MARRVGLELVAEAHRASASEARSIRVFVHRYRRTHHRRVSLYTASACYFAGLRERESADPGVMIILENGSEVLIAVGEALSGAATMSLLRGLRDFPPIGGLESMACRVHKIEIGRASRGVPGCRPAPLAGPQVAPSKLRYLAIRSRCRSKGAGALGLGRGRARGGGSTPSSAGWSAAPPPTAMALCSDSEGPGVVSSKSDST